jgi:hypothetical protein
MMNVIGMTSAQINEMQSAFGALTTDQIKAALVAAGVAEVTIARHGNVYNQIRVGAIDAAIGTLKAGSSADKHKRARKALRKALRPLIPHL